MLHRLVMTLLIACLTLPATAMPLTSEIGDCHGMVEMFDIQHSTPQNEKSAPAKHECIGCVLPVPEAGHPRETHIADRQMPHPSLSSQLDGDPLRPETPPPRG